MFKLYKKIDGEIYYREAWINAGVVTEHWGKCGTTGEFKEYPHDDASDAPKKLNLIRSTARTDGYKPLPLSRHKILAISYIISIPTKVEDLDRRHRIEEFIDNKIGWLGLGHTDGGEIGSGSMEIFCFVVHFDIAKDSIEKALIKSEFSDFHRIYQLSR